MQHGDVMPSQLASAHGRDVAALQDPRPAVIVGARAQDGRIGFATVIWVTPLSHSPALVAFALREKSHTMGIIQETELFSLSIPLADTEGTRLVEHCGSTSGHREDKGAAVAHELLSLREDANGNNTPLLPVPLHAYSWELCEVHSIQEAGDHLLVIGEVLRSATRAPRSERGQLMPTGSLLCVQHGCYAKACMLTL